MLYGRLKLSVPSWSASHSSVLQPRSLQSSMSRPTQAKCQQCASLTAQAAQALHGPNGDACWNPTVCHRRRSHYRHRQQNNQKRQQNRHWQTIQDTLSAFMAQPPAPQKDFTTFLYLYIHQEQNDKHLHAIGIALWQGQTLKAQVPLTHCLGIESEELKVWLAQTLKRLSQSFGRIKVDHLVELEAQSCPLQPCPLHPEALGL